MATPLNPRLAQWLARGEYVQLRGHQVFMRCEGVGPALLLLHGYPTSSYDWRAVWPQLAEHYCVIALDMVGFGFSDKPADYAYSLSAHADVHDALLARLGVKRVHLLAHDLGVSVAQEMLARRLAASAGNSLAPIDSVVFLNGGLCPEAYRPRVIQRLLSSRLGPWLAPRIPRRAFDRSVQSIFAPSKPPAPELLQDFWELVNLRGGLRLAHKTGRFYLERLAQRERLVAPLLRRPGDEGHVPIRLINGTDDPNSGAAMANRYQAVVPDADIVRLNGVGHWPQLEAPQAVLDAALPWLVRRH